MENRHYVDALFGPSFIDEELIPRMVATTRNTRESAEMKLDNAIAYLMARAAQDRVDAALVCNLGPDEAWHTFILFTREYGIFCDIRAGEFIHHDPAGEAALVNSAASTAYTVQQFEKLKLHYDHELWCDAADFPEGAVPMKSGYRRRLRHERRLRLIRELKRDG